MNPECDRKMDRALQIHSILKVHYRIRFTAVRTIRDTIKAKHETTLELISFESSG